jgi:hypothetical protein
VSPDRALLLALTQPWLLARALLSLGAVLTLLAAGALAGRRGRETDGLLRAAIRAAAWAQAASLVLGAFAAKRLVAAVPGAMCAAGVLGASPWGPRAALAAVGAALALAVAEGAAAVDARLRHARMRGALLAGGALALLACAADLAAGLRFAASLNLDDAVPCCASPAASALSVRGAPALSAGLLAAGLSLLAARARTPAPLAWAALAGAWALASREAARALAAGSDHRCLACGLGRAPWGPLLAASCALGALALARGVAPLGLLGGAPGERAAAALTSLRRANQTAVLWGLVTFALTRAAAM